MSSLDWGGSLPGFGRSEAREIGSRNNPGYLESEIDKHNLPFIKKKHANPQISSSFISIHDMRLLVAEKFANFEHF